MLAPLTDPIDEVSDMEEVDYTTITATGVNDPAIKSPASMFTPNAASPQVRIDGRRGGRMTAGVASAAAAAATGKSAAGNDSIIQASIAATALSSLSSSSSWPFWPLPRSLQSVIESKKFSWRLLFFAYRTVRR